MKKNIFIFGCIFFFCFATGLSNKYVLTVDDQTTRDALSKTYSSVLSEFQEKGRVKLFIASSVIKTDKDLKEIPVYTTDTIKKIKRTLSKLTTEKPEFFIIIIPKEFYSRSPNEKAQYEILAGDLLDKLKAVNPASYLLCAVIDSSISKDCFNKLKNKLSAKEATALIEEFIKV